ncbi:DUF2922 family protein [Heliobacillus mobilis]|uniref:DUF2922 family protein n=2 Tax=Heliobacterium TaxID=2697 RepID=A0A6I3SNN9_HELMO|nr:MULTISPECIES: DUF2922 domain-containing protein [Heliobacterium]MBC9785352.1 DUF2922 domain-containing protein [Heliobacterium chlorum]MTV48369.1 DUF2922 family protein [Heliobacterium mobile]MTV50519.1 DUF2922 family protein [Heliobacterium mobile]
MATKETLELVFTNQLGRDVVLRVRDPKAGLTTDEVTTVMDTIIANNVFTTSGGDLIGKKDVRMVSSNVTDLYNP